MFTKINQNSKCKQRVRLPLTLHNTGLSFLGKVLCHVIRPYESLVSYPNIEHHRKQSTPHLLYSSITWPMSLYLPNPCLQGIILVISTHNGPQSVFHYPPKPNEYGYLATPFAIDNDLLNAETIESDDTDDDSANSYSDASGSYGQKSGNDPKYVSGQTLLDLLDEKDRKKEEKAKLRSRQKSNKKSSISSMPLDQINTNSVHTNESIKAQQESLRKVFGFETEFLSEILSPPRQLCNSKFEFTVDDLVFLGLPIHVNDKGEWRTHKQRREAKSRRSTNASNNSTKGDQGDENISDSAANEDSNIHHETSDSNQTNEVSNTLSMFHVVFVMNPPVAEYNYRVDEMFHFVVSRLSLVLRYEQAKSNYIWNESIKILKIKENNDHLPLYELYSKLLSESSLANSIAQCFNSISTSDIVNLEINGKLISLQIPLRNQFKSLPPKSVSVLPGSYLSSIMVDDEPTEDDDDNMGHMALLLLDEPEKIISDLKTETNSPLGTFIRNIHPMMSLNKQSLLTQLDIAQLISFAKHLIYWRRARAIFPLNTKSVFIVSPMAPLKSIQQDSKVFRQSFQALPSLPSFLALISNSKPRQYSAIIPSRDHRDTYLDALAWLIKSGYVTQLLTFVWIKIPNRIKIAVEEDLEREGLTKKVKDKSRFADISTDNTSKDTDDLKKNDESSTSVQMTINGRDVTIIEEEEEDTILLDPERATAVERRWISKVIKGQPPELVAVFHKVMKYFNGKTPVELITMKENVARQDLKRLLHGISDNVISVKHW